MFINLHVHSAKGSLLDSILTTQQIVDYAKANGQTAIGLSDHGTMHASLNLVNDCRKAGIKPITACEIYECDNHLEQNPDDKYHHLLLIAKNTVGLHNLYKIVSEGYVHGFYRKPRVSVKWIKDNDLGEGIICLTACQAGRVSRYLEQDKRDDAEDFVRLLKDTFDYVALEIQSHPTAQQIKCNFNILGLALNMNMPYVITSDAHMATADQLETHSIFVGISQDREVSESYVGCHLQNENDVWKYLKGTEAGSVIQKGIDETVHIANMVDDDIDYELNKGTIMPKAHIPDGYDVESYFRHLVYSTFDEKFGHMSKEAQQKRRDRIEEEIPVLKELDFLNYLLIQHEFCNECDKRGIPRGYSRGSAANCLCVFMLGITQIDSVRWDLDFSRFANIGRKGSVADIDLDISKSRRQEAIKVLCDIFGADHVAPMATFNTLSTKVAIKDVAKVLNEKEDSPYYGQIPYSIRDEIAGMIPTIKTLNDLGEEEEKETLLKDLVGKNDKLDKYYAQFPLLFKYVMELEGLPKSRGRHASGTLLTPLPIIHYSPLCFDNDKNIMSMYDMHICQDTKGGLGLCKEDLLGLETLDIVDMALKNANLTWHDVDINHINLDDKQVYDEVYKPGNTVNVFQMESFEARNMLIEAQANNIEDIVVVNAANRPGTKDSFPDYCNNKLHSENVTVIHPDLIKLFKQSQAVLLYQEQALSLLRYAGFPEEMVETGRRAISKKQESEMKSLKAMFIDGLKKRAWNDEQIESIWNLLLKQSSYCFNRGHAVAYGLMSYLTAYLKVHYPAEFQAAALTSKSGNTSKISAIINDCHRMGIKVLPPNVNKSGRDFTAIPDKHEILFGLMAVKGIGASVIDDIIALRPFANFKDYVDRMPRQAAIQLIKAGGIPTKDKAKALRRYAELIYVPTTYKPSTTLPTKQKLLLDFNINKDDFKVGKKYDTERILEIYNQKRFELYQAKESLRHDKVIFEFESKYCNDEMLWEFETLSMFLTDNPLKEANSYISKPWDSIPEGEKGVAIAVVVDVTSKKDKHGNVYYYVSLYTPFGIVEATAWASIVREYGHLLKKCKCVAIYGRKAEGGHLFVEQVKPYSQWLEDRKIKRKKAGG